MPSWLLNALLAVGGLLIGVLVGWFIGYAYRKKIAEARIGSAEDEAKRIVEDAHSAAEAAKKETVLEAKDEVHRLRTELDREIRDRRNEVARTERRLQQREDSLDKKGAALEAREDKLNRVREEIERLQESAEALHAQQMAELERISGLTAEDARAIIMQHAEEEARHCLLYTSPSPRD